MGLGLRSRYKLRGAYLIVQLIGAVFLLMLFAMAGAFSGTHVVDTYRDDLIIREGEALDYAITLYSKEHTTSYPTGKMDKDGNPIVNTYGIYPNVSDLNRNDIMARYGYISFFLSKNIHGLESGMGNCPVGTFHYQVSADRRAYKLQAKLNTGYIYTTPGSLYTIKELDGGGNIGSTISSTKGDWGSSISGKKKKN